jgi:hypothetical protein
MQRAACRHRRATLVHGRHVAIAGLRWNFGPLLQRLRGRQKFHGACIRDLSCRYRVRHRGHRSVTSFGQGPIRREGYRELAVEVTKNTCAHFVSVSPKPNHRYRVKQDIDRGTCAVAIVDVDRNYEPVDTIELDSSACPIPKL